MCTIKKITKLDIYHRYLTDRWGSHESMTCESDGIYLTFGNFNGTNLILSFFFPLEYMSYVRGFSMC